MRQTDLPLRCAARLLQILLKSRRIVVQPFTFLCSLCAAKTAEALCKAGTFCSGERFRCGQLLQCTAGDLRQLPLAAKLPVQALQVCPAIPDLLPDAL